MLVTDKNKKYLLIAMEVDFLTEVWERDLYAYSLMKAVEWSKKIDKQRSRLTSMDALKRCYNT